MIDHKEFVQQLRIMFPEMTNEIDPKIESGLLHLEMAAFARLTRKYVEAEDIETAVAAFLFAGHLLDKGDDSVVNAVYVSYLENLEFERQSDRWAFHHMSPRLKAAWKEIAEHNDEIHGTDIADRISHS